MKKLSHCLNGYEQAAANVTLRSIRSSMERERARTRPRVPATLAELDPVLREFDQTRPIYRGMARGRDGSVALVLGTNLMLPRLSTATEIFMDGTFRVSIHV